LSRDTRANVKIKRETHDELTRYARKLAVELDRRVTIDEAIIYAIRSLERKQER
jgi:hypothetical protein